MYMPTEISQKNIFSKLAAKLTIPVGGLCSNKFQIKKKMFYLNTNNTEILQKHSHNSKSPQRISSKLSTMNPNESRVFKKIGFVPSVYRYEVVVYIPGLWHCSWTRRRGEDNRWHPQCPQWQQLYYSREATQNLWSPPPSYICQSR